MVQKFGRFDRQMKFFMKRNPAIRRHFSKNERNYIMDEMRKHQSIGGITKWEFDRKIEGKLKKDTKDPVSKTHAKIFKRELFKYMDKAEEDTAHKAVSREYFKPLHNQEDHAESATDHSSESGVSAIHHPPYQGLGSATAARQASSSTQVDLPPPPHQSGHGLTSLQRLSNDLNGLA